jgi:DNA-binding GntR family transcriptional regulator
VTDADEPERLPRSNLGDEVYRLLWKRILDHGLRPGDKLSDLRLSHELGVSRTPMREALRRLVSDGIVRAERNRGFFVASFSASDIAEIYDLRATLEIMALLAAAPQLTADILTSAQIDLDNVEARLKGASTESEKQEAYTAFLEVDRGFHRLLVELAGNSRLRNVVEGLWAQIAVFQWAGGFRDHWTASAITRHRSIIAAMLEGDVERAAEELRQHIDEVKVWAIEDLGAAKMDVAPAAARSGGLLVATASGIGELAAHECLTWREPAPHESGGTGDMESG